MKELDVVALTVDREDLGLVRGQVGTLVAELSPTDFEVEFVDVEGYTYALAALSTSELLLLVYDGEGIGLAAA